MIGPSRRVGVRWHRAAGPGLRRAPPASVKPVPPARAHLTQQAGHLSLIVHADGEPGQGLWSLACLTHARVAGPCLCPCHPMAPAPPELAH